MTSPPLSVEQLARIVQDPLKRWRHFRSLLDFMADAWHVLEPGKEFVRGRALEQMAACLEAVTEGRLRRLLINVPPGFSKALATDTPVLTTWGWKRHGDLRPGDFVFAPNGQPVRVQGVTDHMLQPMTRVEFDDGESLLASAGHQWVVDRDHGETPRKCRSLQCATPDLKAGDRPDSIKIASPIQTPPRTLLVDPYVLGAWLGDGSSTQGCIYASEQDVAAFLPYGRIAHTLPPGGTRKQPFHRVLVPDLHVKLRVMGLMRNKHVPTEYLEASEPQRWALLQGLMDTDGCATKQGLCTFSNLNERIALSVHQLAASLGMKSRIRSRFSMLNGRQYGPHYLVQFSPSPGAIVFRLARKQSRLCNGKNPRTRSRYLRALTPAGDGIANCIQVEGGMYLAGRSFIPTHNSMMVNVFWPAWEWGPRGMPHHRFISASYEKGLSTRDLVRCRDLVHSEWFQERWPITFKEDQDQKTYYENEVTGWRLASSVGGAMTGYRGDRIIIDDPHSVRTAESDAERGEARRWFSETLPTRLNEQDKSAIVMIMQRLHERDLSGLVLKELSSEWSVLVLPMEYEVGRHCSILVNGKPLLHRDGTLVGDWRTEDGELLWPARFSREGVDSLKRALSAEGGSYAVAGQLQQRPVPRGGGMFKRAAVSFVDSCPKGGRRVRGWDLAATDGAGCHTVGLRLSIVEGRLYIEDVVRGQMSSYAVEQAIVAAAQQDGHGVSVSLPQDPGQAGKSQKARLASLLHGTDVHFSTETGSKVDRATPCAAQWEAGNVTLVRGPWNDRFLGELELFGPTSGNVDTDQVDAFSRAYAYLLTHADTSGDWVPGLTIEG